MAKQRPQENANNNVIDEEDIGTAISDWTEEKWARYAGCQLVIDTDNEREKVIGVVRAGGTFNRDDYPDCESVELFPVPHRGGIAATPEVLPDAVG